MKNLILKTAKKLGLTTKRYFKCRVDNNAGASICNVSVQDDGSWTYSNLHVQEMTFSVKIPDTYEVIKEASGGLRHVNKYENFVLGTTKEVTNQEFWKMYCKLQYILITLENYLDFSAYGTTEEYHNSPLYKWVMNQRDKDLSDCVQGLINAPIFSNKLSARDFMSKCEIEALNKASTGDDLYNVRKWLKHQPLEEKAIPTQLANDFVFACLGYEPKMAALGAAHTIAFMLRSVERVAL